MVHVYGISVLSSVECSIMFSSSCCPHIAPLLSHCCIWSRSQLDMFRTLVSIHVYCPLLWNLSTRTPLGPHKMVHNTEVFLFQRLFSTVMYYIGTLSRSVLVSECPYQRGSTVIALISSIDVCPKWHTGILAYVVERSSFCMCRCNSDHKSGGKRTHRRKENTVASKDNIGISQSVMCPYIGGLLVLYILHCIWGRVSLLIWRLHLLFEASVVRSLVLKMVFGKSTLHAWCIYLYIMKHDFYAYILLIL